MDIERRRLLQGLAAATLCFGLDGLAHGSEAEPTDAPPWLKEALAEMSATGSPGIGIVLPKGRTERGALRDTLQQVLDRVSSPPKSFLGCDGLEWLVEAVFVVAPGGRFGALRGETLVLLEPDGRRAGGSTVALDAESLSREVRALLRQGGRLERRAQAARTTVVQRALDDLQSSDRDVARAAHRWLVDHFAETGPAVIAAAARDSPSIGVERVLCTVLSARVHSGTVDSAVPERPLPYGMTWLPDARPDPCPGCGMATRPREMDLLQFLGDDSPTPR